MNFIKEELKTRILEELPNSEGKQVESFYRFKETKNFVEIIGTSEENTNIRVHEQALNSSELAKCKLENNNRTLKAKFWVEDLNSVEDALALILKSHAYVQKN